MSLLDHLTTFQSLVVLGDYKAAYAAFSAALDEFPGEAFRVFTTSASSQLDQTIARADRIEETVDRLDSLIDDHPNVHLLVGAEHQIPSLVRLREANIARGLPSPILVAQGKSASTSVARIFNSGFNLPSFSFSLITLSVIPKWLIDYGRGGASHTTHLTPRPEEVDRFKRAGIRRIIVHTRDPRQAMVSYVHHLDRYSDQLTDVSRGLEDELGGHAGVSRKIGSLLDEYRERIRWIEGWIEVSRKIEILFSTFEDYVRDPEGFIDRYLSFYGGPTEYFNREAAMTNQEGTDYHFRQGRTDEWREVLPRELQKKLTDLLPEALMERFGWAQ